MDGNNGLWFSFPQVKGDQDGETKYFDQMFLTPLEREHVRNLVISDLQSQGHIERPKQQRPKSNSSTKKTSLPSEDLSEHYTSATQDDIPW